MVSPTVDMTGPLDSGGHRPTQRTSRVRYPFAWVFIAIFVVLLMTRIDILTLPPYIEQATPLWTEANFLVDTKFDFQRLLLQELNIDEGGPRSYVYSALPSLIAALMLVLETPTSTFLAYHVFVIGCAALILMNIVRLTWNHVGWIAAFAIAAAVATLPWFSAQVDLMGMDLPMGAAASFVALAVHRHRFMAAAFTSLVAFTMKVSAFLLSFTTVAYIALLLLVRWLNLSARRRRFLFFAGLVNAALLSLQMGLLFHGDNARTRSHMPRLIDGLLWISSCPELILIMLACAAGSMAQFVRRLRRDGEGLPSGFSPRVWKRALSETMEHEPLMVYGWIIVSLTVLAILPIYFESRYLIVVLPFLAAIAAVVLSFAFAPRTRLIILAGVILLNLANRNGILLLPLPDGLARGWGVLERSHEYLRDHESAIAVCKILEERAPESALMVCEQFTHYVTLPRLGFVSKSLIDGPPEYRFLARDENVLRLFEDQPSDIVAVATFSQLGAFFFPAYSIPKPGHSDKVLFMDDLRPPLYVYHRHFQSPEGSLARWNEYLDFLFSDADDVDGATRFVVLGYGEMARRFVELETGRSWSPEELRVELLRRLEESNLEARPVADVVLGAHYHDALLKLAARRRAELSRPGMNPADIVPATRPERGSADETPQRLLYVPRRWHP